MEEEDLHHHGRVNAFELWALDKLHHDTLLHKTVEYVQKGTIADLGTDQEELSYTENHPFVHCDVAFENNTSFSSLSANSRTNTIPE